MGNFLHLIPFEFYHALSFESIGEEAYIYFFSYLTVAKVGLKHISNDVERCLSLVRCQLLAHCLHSVLEDFFFWFSHAFALSVCGGKDARTTISYNSVVKAGQSNFLLLPTSTFFRSKSFSS